MRNTYVKSKENIRKLSLLHETLTDHICEKCTSQLITKSQKETPIPVVHEQTSCKT